MTTVSEPQTFLRRLDLSLCRLRHSIDAVTARAITRRGDGMSPDRAAAYATRRADTLLRRSWASAHARDRGDYAAAEAVVADALARLAPGRRAAGADWRDRIVAARSRAGSPATLSLLARDSECLVRWIVARNPCTPTATLERLATDSVGLVREAVAWSPCTGADTLAILASDDNWLVRVAVACHHSATPDMLAQLARDSDAAVRVAVACHPSTPSHALAVLESDNCECVSGTAHRRAYYPSSFARS